MYVCLCHAITKKKLNLLIKNGCYSLDKLQKTCGLGKSCGTCLQTANQILLEQKKVSKHEREISKNPKVVEIGNA